MKVEKYEIVFKGVDGEIPHLTGTGKKVPTPNVEQQIKIGDDSAGDVGVTPMETQEKTEQEIYDSYLSDGFDEKTAKALTKNELKQREIKRKAEVKKKKKEEKEAERKRLQEERYQDIVELGLEDLAPYLDIDKNNIIRKTVNNYEVILNKHNAFKGRFNANVFTGQDELDKKPITPRVASKIFTDLERILGYYNEQYAKTAIMNVCTDHPYHPVKEVVDTLVWDKVPRAETFFIDRVGGEDTPLTREMTFKWLYAMVKRIYEPGCFFDHYLVLTDSTQGTGKTGTFQRLTEGLRTSMGSLTNENISIDLSNKDNVLALLDCSIGLLDESSKVKYGDKCEAFKAFMSQRSVVFRRVWEKYNDHVPIHHVVAMTTNDENFLTDSSGDFERRAWVIRCQGDPNRSPEEWEKYNSDEVIQQVWAEMKYYYDHQDESPYKITDKHVTILSQQAKEDLQKLQREVKTSNEDFPCENAICDILEGQAYSKDVFFTAKDFCNDRDSFRYEEQKYTHQLDVIPANWLYEYVNKMIGGRSNRSSRYIRQMILNLVDSGKIGKWKIDNHKYYNKKQTTCWVRVFTTPPTTDGDTEPKKETQNKGFFDVDTNNLPQ